MSTTLAQDAQQYAVLVAQRKDLETEVDILKETLTKLGDDLMGRMGDEGVASLRVDTAAGKFTISPKRTLRASCIAGHQQELNDGLRALGYGDLITEGVNANRLSAYIRELEVAGAEIPKEVVGAIKVFEQFQVSVTKA